MSDHFEKTIQEIESEISSLESRIVQLKQTVNSICKISNKPLRFEDDEMRVASQNFQITSDQFFGKKQATAVREYLNWRKDANQDPPADVDTIYDGLEQGGYKFDKYGKRGLSIALAKNTRAFVKLNGDKYGLVEWYPDLKTSKSRKNSNSEESDQANDKETSSDNNDEASDEMISQ